MPSTISPERSTKRSLATGKSDSTHDTAQRYLKRLSPSLTFFMFANTANLLNIIRGCAAVITTLSCEDVRNTRLALFSFVKIINADLVRDQINSRGRLPSPNDEALPPHFPTSAYAARFCRITLARVLHRFMDGEWPIGFQTGGPLSFTIKACQKIPLKPVTKGPPVLSVLINGRRECGYAVTFAYVRWRIDWSLGRLAQ